MSLYCNFTFPTQNIATLCGIFIVLFGSVGCSVVHVYGNSPSISRNFGIVKIQLPADGKIPTLVTTEGIGIIMAAQSTTVGWTRESAILVPDSTVCRVFIIVQGDEEIKSLKEKLTQQPNQFENLCILSKEGGKWPNY